MTPSQMFWVAMVGTILTSVLVQLPAIILAIANARKINRVDVKADEAKKTSTETALKADIAKQTATEVAVAANSRMCSVQEELGILHKATNSLNAQLLTATEVGARAQGKLEEKENVAMSDAIATRITETVDKVLKERGLVPPT